MGVHEFENTIASLRVTLAGFTHRFTSNREDSNDLVQDTMLKALTYRDKFRNDTNLKGWLFTIMRNTYINNYHRERQANTSRDSSKELYKLNVEDDHTFNRPVESLEFKEVWQNIHTIKEELLQPFRMFLTGYKYHEIAKHLDLPIGTVKNRIFQARKEIQKKLVGYY